MIIKNGESEITFYPLKVIIEPNRKHLESTNFIRHQSFFVFIGNTLNDTGK